LYYYEMKIFLIQLITYWIANKYKQIKFNIFLLMY
jgi:hypothetical protein